MWTLCNLFDHLLVQIQASIAIVLKRVAKSRICAHKNNQINLRPNLDCEHQICNSESITFDRLSLSPSVDHGDHLIDDLVTMANHVIVLVSSLVSAQPTLPGSFAHATAKRDIDSCDESHTQHKRVCWIPHSNMRGPRLSCPRHRTPS